MSRNQTKRQASCGLWGGFSAKLWAFSMDRTGDASEWTKQIPKHKDAFVGIRWEDGLPRHYNRAFSLAGIKIWQKRLGLRGPCGVSSRSVPMCRRGGGKCFWDQFGIQAKGREPHSPVKMLASRELRPSRRGSGLGRFRMALHHRYICSLPSSTSL